MQIHINNMRLADTAAAYAIEQADVCSPWTENLIKDCINREHYYNWGLFIDEILVGYCLTTARANEAELLTIAIHPAHRKQGYAERLLQHAMTELLPLATCVFLEVRVTNDAARALYEKLGFKKIAERKNYYRQGDGCRDALVYKKDL